MPIKILFTTPMLMHPAASGPHLRIENSIKALAKISELHIVSRVPAFQLGSPQAMEYFKKLAASFVFSPSVHNLSHVRTIRRFQILLRKVIYNDAQFIVKYARQNQIKIIWFGYGNLSYSLIKQVKLIAPELKLVCDTDSVWSRFLFRELPFVEDNKEKSRILSEVLSKEREEKEWVQMCDITTAVSEVDADYYRNLTSDSNKIAIFSNVLDLNSYSADVAPPPGLKGPSLYLAGSFGKSTSAMNRAALWLINDILPLVKKQIPTIHCYIVGNHSDVSFGHLRDPAITVTGRVESVLPYLKNIDVALTPLQFESGTRFKILEAAACQKPMVSTTLGAEGLPVNSEEHILIADKTEEFANAIIRLIQDSALAKQISQKSYQLIKQDFSLERLVREAECIFEKMGLA